jgi:hypothetical protein
MPNRWLITALMKGTKEYKAQGVGMGFLHVLPVAADEAVKNLGWVKQHFEELFWKSRRLSFTCP